MSALEDQLLNRFVLSLISSAFVLNHASFAQSPSQPPDTTRHSTKFVTVQPGVKLEVLDYGGTGRGMIFLAALGPDAHDWDKFAPKFVHHYHVHAMNRNWTCKTRGSIIPYDESTPKLHFAAVKIRRRCRLRGLGFKGFRPPAPSE